jgi:hypothetical protein
MFGYEESKGGLLDVSCQTTSADSVSTMTMGVAHCGQRKQVGCVGAELVTVGG